MRLGLGLVLFIVAVFGATWLALDAIEQSGRRELPTNVAQFLDRHACKRDHYTAEGVIVYSCSNGPWTERDIERFITGSPL